jgi:hypothetical protein
LPARGFVLSALVVVAAIGGGCRRSPAATVRAASGPEVRAASSATCGDPWAALSTLVNGPCACGDEAACVAKCDRGSADDCASLGACSATLALGHPPDHARAYAYSKKGCDLGSPLACTNVGDAYRKGVGTKADAALADAAFARAFSAYRAGCAADDANACHMLSHAYEGGQGVAADAAQARALREKSCALGGLISCLLLVADAREAGRDEEVVTRSARVCESTCWCDPVLEARERGSPAAAQVVASFRARCARGDAPACAAAQRVESRPVGLWPRAVFTGNHALTSDALAAWIRIDKLDGLLPGGRPRDDVLERAWLLLNVIYYDEGYLDVRVDKSVLAPAAQGTYLDVRFHVEEGQRYRLGKVTVGERDARGQTAAPLAGRDLRALVRLRDGDWFSRASLGSDLSAIERLYRDAGYGDVEARPVLQQDAARAVVDVDVPVRRGPLVRIERIRITGNVNVPADAIRKEIPLVEGQLFSQTGLEEAKKRLQSLGAFRTVDVSTEATPDATRWTVMFEVEEVSLLGVASRLREP